VNGLGRGSFGWTWPAWAGGVLARGVHYPARSGVCRSRRWIVVGQECDRNTRDGLAVPDFWICRERTLLGIERQIAPPRLARGGIFRGEMMAFDLEGRIMELTQQEEERRKKARSKAVIAANDKGFGCVVWYVGPGLTNEIEEVGLHELGDLGLDDAPEGISVWEGVFVWQPGPYEHPDDGDLVPSGTFRKPTDEEWIAIREGRNPWPGLEARRDDKSI
jgi:hypothetical protein